MTKPVDCLRYLPSLRLLWFSLVAWLVPAPGAAQHPAPNPTENRFASRPAIGLKLGLPIDCTPGKDCHVLAYFDHLPGAAFEDFGGGRQTYDGHDGTDFGIASDLVMKQGVAVKAAAGGIVAQARDGMADQRVENPAQAEAVNHLGCGNAVVIDHPDHWRTYYCHLRQGSLRVTPGIRVEKGTVLAMVGSSGLASFPHVHFGVLHHGKPVDPFTGTQAAHHPSASQPSLWEGSINYVATGLISASFSDQKADINAIWQGMLSPSYLPDTAAAIVFWAHPFGVLAGDSELLRLIAPDGTTIAERRVVLMSHNRINRVNWVGKRGAPRQKFQTGIWRGQYQLRRNEKLLIDIQREIDVRQE